MRRLLPLVLLALVSTSHAQTPEEVTLTVADFESGSAWPGGSGDKGGVGKGEIVATEAHGGKQCLAFHYDFSGTTGTAFLYARVQPNLALRGTPSKLTFWVKGDGSRRPLTVRLTEAGGEVWQRVVGQLDFTDWRRVTVPMTSQGAFSWGGPQDKTRGVLDLPVRLTDIIVDKASETAPATGVLYLDDFALTTVMAPEDRYDVKIDAPGLTISASARPQTIKAKVSVLSAYSKDAEAAVTWRLVDYRDRRIESGRETVQVPASGVVEIPLSLTLAEQGYFELSAVAQIEGVAYRSSLPLRILRPSAQTELNPESSIGINGHLASAAEMEMMQRGGIKWMRADWLWSVCQPQAGDFNWKTLDSRYEAARKAGISLLPILCYGVPWASTKPEGGTGDATRYIPRMEAWLAYVKAVVGRYKEGIHYWEVWNEPNIGFWLSSNEDYVRLLKETYTAIKQVDPTATVLMGGTAGAPPSYVEMLYKAGCKDFMDIVNVHPYQYPRVPDEGMAQAVRKVWEVMNRYGDGTKPIWVTEVGYPNHLASNGVTLHRQAECLARTYLCMLGMGVQKVFWYDYQNGNDPYYNEANFGVVFSDNRPKPCYFALKTISDLLGDARFVEQPAAPPGVAAYLFRRTDGTQVLALWAVKDRATVSLLQAGATRLTDLMGNTRVLKSEEAVGLELDGSPVFISSGKAPVISSIVPLKLEVSAAEVFPTTSMPVTVTVANPTSAPLEGVVDAELPGGWTIGKFAGRVQLAPGETRTFRLECAANPDTAYGPYELRFAFTGWAGSRRLRYTEAASVELKAPWKVEYSTTHEGASVRLAAEVTNLLDHSVRASAYWAAPGYLAGGRGDGGQRWELFRPGEPVTVQVPESWVPHATAAPYWSLLLKIDTLEMPPASYTTRFSGALAPRATEALLALPLDATMPGVLPLRYKEQVQQIANWGGVKDLSALAQVLWTEKDLVVRAVVRDDHSVQPFLGENTWQGDGLQFAVDPGYLHTPTSAYFEYAVALTQQGSEVYREAAAPGVTARTTAKATVEERTDGRVYTVRVPWSELGIKPAAGLRLGFSLLANDNDGGGRRGWIEWGGGIGWTKDPSLYLDVTLGE
ncbi:MAG: sugar-binding protein [Armatimonadia bacterium]